MNTALLISILLGSNWSTSCVMTQENGTSGFVKDSLSFEKKPANELKVTFSRVWFKDAACTESLDKSSNVSAKAAFGSKIQDSFGQAMFEADWCIEGKACEKGALSLSDDRSTVKISRGFGMGRNTMLSLFGYKAVN